MDTFQHVLLWFVLSPVIAVGLIIATLFWLVILAGICDLFIEVGKAINKRRQTNTK